VTQARRCTARHCYRTLAGNNTAVEQAAVVSLCTDHRAALRRMCKGKQRFPYAKLAQREAGRLIAARAARPAMVPTPYRCPLCEQWHVGNQRPGDTDVDQAARFAADAVRANASAEQVRALILGWSPAAARRPSRSRQRSRTADPLREQT